MEDDETLKYFLIPEKLNGKRIYDIQHIDNAGTLSILIENDLCNYQINYKELMQAEHFKMAYMKG